MHRTVTDNATLRQIESFSYTKTSGAVNPSSLILDCTIMRSELLLEMLRCVSTFMVTV